MQDLTCSAHEVIIFEVANNLLFRDVKNGKNMQDLIAALLFCGDFKIKIELIKLIRLVYQQSKMGD